MGAQVIASYELNTVVSQSPVAKVYRATDKRDGSTVAVKQCLVPPALQGSARDEFLTRLRKQANTAMHVGHPCLVLMVDVFEEGGFIFLVTEFVEGLTVRDVLKQENFVAVSRAANIAAQVGEALDENHIKGVIHRGVTVDNILLARDGSVKLSPFSVGGLAADAMQAQEELRHDLRSDRFFLGTGLYEMLTGRQPFPADSFAKGGDPPPAPGVPEYMVAILRKAFAEYPPSRYQTGKDMAVDIREQHAPQAPRPAPRVAAGGTGGPMLGGGGQVLDPSIPTCVYHQGHNATATCEKCGKLICADCISMKSARLICKPCAIKLYRPSDSVLCSAICCLLGLVGVFVYRSPLVCVGALVFGFLAVRRRECAKRAIYVGLFFGSIGLMMTVAVRLLFR